MCVRFGIEDKLFYHVGLTEIEMVTYQEMGLYREVIKTASSQFAFHSDDTSLFIASR
jgi:hypothetical protein